MKIDEKMKSLIFFLKKGLNGILFSEIAESCLNDWNQDYAIIKNVFQTSNEDYDEYFDSDKLNNDLKNYVFDHFNDGTEKIVFYDKEKHSSGTIIINFTNCKELEVYRVK